MTTEGLWAIALGVLTLLGAFIAWVGKWVRSMVKNEIATYDRQQKDAEIKDLKDQNQRLKDYIEKGKG